MRDLFRRSSFLFWQYPILWLPVAIADVAELSFTQLQAWLNHTLMRGLAGHSVLGSTPDPLQAVLPTFAMILGAIRFLVVFLQIFLYVAAMIAISILIPALVGQRSLPWRKILSALNQSRLRILFLSSKIFALLMVAGGLGISLIFYEAKFRWLPAIGIPAISPRDFGVVAAGLLFAAAAYLLASSAMTLLHPRDSPLISKGINRLARISAALAVLASTAVYFSMVKIEPSFISSSTPAIGSQVFWYLESFLSAVPYILLFIALSLLATTDDHVTAFTAEPAEDTPPAEAVS